jgi:hypothetical protein
MKKHVDSFSQASPGNGHLVPNELARSTKHTFANVGSIRELPRCRDTPVEEYVLVLAIHIEEFARQVSGVDPDSALLLDGAEHDSDSHWAPLLLMNVIANLDPSGPSRPNSQLLLLLSCRLELSSRPAAPNNE